MRIKQFSPPRDNKFMVIDDTDYYFLYKRLHPRYKTLDIRGLNMTRVDKALEIKRLRQRIKVTELLIEQMPDWVEDLRKSLALDILRLAELL